MSDCIFCKIVQGEIPAIKVYEDDKVLAFMDINPLNDGHTLVVPKQHAETILEIAAEDLTAVIQVVQKVALAIEKGLKPDGLTVIQLNKKASGQVVPHLHIHLIPRFENDGLTISKWQLVAGDMEKIKQVAEEIRRWI